MPKYVMTKRERVLRAARFEETDRVPLYDILQNDAIIEHYAAPLLHGARLDARNGAQATRVRGYVAEYFNRAPSGPGQAALKPGKNLISIHCHQTGGGQYIDLGFVAVEAN